jgi:hypothetical protein
MGEFRWLKMLLVVGALGSALRLPAASGQKPLERRSGVVDPELQAIYESAEFAEAYTAADALYNKSNPSETYTPAAWNPHKQLLWVTNTEEQLGRYSLAFERFRDQLDATARMRQTRANAEKVAQISELQDRLTADNLNTLNTMVKGLALASFFTSNHQPDLAIRWSPWTVPETKRVLNNSEMGDVLKFLFTVDECLRKSKDYHVQYSRSSSFSWDVPRDENDKPLTPQEARWFWQWDTHKPVDDALVALFHALNRAQATAAAEGLFRDPMQNKATTEVATGH